MYDMGNDSSVALKVGKKLLMLAEELDLTEYVTDDNFVKKIVGSLRSGPCGKTK